MLEKDLKINWLEIVPKLTAFIKEKMEELNREGIILGISGGLDSAVLASLCQKAVGKDRVLGLILPERDSSPETLNDAKEIANFLAIKTLVKNIAPKIKSFGAYRILPTRYLPRATKHKLVQKLYHYYNKKTGKTAFEAGLLGSKGSLHAQWLNRINAYYRIKHRVRMVYLYYLAELRNLLVASSANKTEWQVGFFVKGGCDGVGDIMPLLPFYKTQIRELAKYLKLPKKILEKPPSPDIMPGITDEFAIGIPFEKLDLILLGLEKKMPFEEIANEVETEISQVEYTASLFKKSEHFRKVFVPEI